MEMESELESTESARESESGSGNWSEVFIVLVICLVATDPGDFVELVRRNGRILCLL